MHGKSSRYTFVVEFLGGTYVHQGSGHSPELALRAWLRNAGEDELEWAQYRVELMRALIDQIAIPVEGCKNVWCMSGLAGDYLFLIHIIGTENGSAASNSVAEAELEQTGTEPRRWGWGDHR
jgi:hypothetical protein